MIGIDDFTSFALGKRMFAQEVFLIIMDMQLVLF
jgi:hypothetical protein